jgi:hypothetical protein
MHPVALKNIGIVLFGMLFGLFLAVSAAAA